MSLSTALVHGLVGIDQLDGAGSLILNKCSRL